MLRYASEGSYHAKQKLWLLIETVKGPGEITRIC